MSGDSIKIALAQLDLLVGDVQGNLARVLAEAQRAGARGAQLVVFPELALSGYPPEDLLFHRGLRAQVEQALDSLEAAVATGPELPAVLLGYPEYEGQQGAPRIYNAASLLHRGSPRANYRKICLPNYRVFDEKRYFTAGNAAKVVELHGFRIGLLVCEDIWEPDPARAAQAAGAEMSSQTSRPMRKPCSSTTLAALPAVK